MLLHKGDVLFRQGETGPLYRIRSGLLKVVRIQTDGSMFVFNLLVPGEVIPHHSLITPKDYHGTGIALVASEVDVIPADEWYRELEENPENYRDVALMLQDKLRMTQRRIDQLTAAAPSKRLSLLQDWLRSYVPDTDLSDILTQEEIGQFIGLRRETVNRLLRGK